MQPDGAAAKNGHLKILVGYASGVGKSFRMIDEARRRRERGQDVVIGAVQRKASLEVEDLLRHMEVVPLKGVPDRAGIDLDALIKRRPAVCFIDGLAYNNPPGSRNAARWQDVQDLLDAGIKVVASINIQYVTELRERVESITGKHVDETVPVSFIQSADEIEVIDAPPEDPLVRTPEERIDAKRREQQLSKLRELTLVLAADVVDRQLEQYLDRHGIRQHLGAQERILICITPRANVAQMMTSARGIVAKFHAELTAAYVSQPDISAEDQAALDKRLEIVRSAGAGIQILEGEDPVSAILDFAHQKGITQLFIGHSQRSGFGAWLWGNPVDRLIRRSRGMDVRVFPQ